MIVSQWSSTDSGLSFCSTCPSSTPNLLHSPTVLSQPSLLSGYTKCQSAPDSPHEEDNSDKVCNADNVEDDDFHLQCSAMWRPDLRDGLLYIELHTVHRELGGPPVSALETEQPCVRVGVESKQVEHSRSWMHVLVVLSSLLSLCVGAPIAFLLAALARSTMLTETAIHMLVLLY